MKDNFFKSWKTTLLGLIILALFVYSVLSEGKGFDIADVANLIPILSALGFIISKDATTSHSRGTDTIGGSIPPKKKKDGN